MGMEMIAVLPQPSFSLASVQQHANLRDLRGKNNYSGEYSDFNERETMHLQNKRGDSDSPTRGKGL